MAGYQRFVAYVYEYRKGKKSQNCGFVKVEVRDNRCRLEANLQCPGLTPQVPCKIYGFVRNSGLLDGILLGICQTKDGAVQYVAELDARDMNHSGVALGKFGGMILKTESGAFFGTEWDDQAIRPENFRERMLKKEEPISNAVKSSARREEWENDKKVMQEVNSGLDTERESGIESELRAELKAEKESEAEQESQKGLEPQKQSELPKGLEPQKEQESHKELEPETETKPEIKSEKNPAEELESELESEMETKTEMTETQSAPETNIQSLHAAEMQEPESAEQPSPMPTGSTPQRPPQPRCVTRFPQMGEAFDPFGDGEIRNPRRIQLKDVANFPCRDCALKQNRFLQHGYTQFGHLMIGQMPSGCYIIGVPGMYNQQEQFMANMFGFPYFKESRAIRVLDGKGGYWYRSINAADFD